MGTVTVGVSIAVPEPYGSFLQKRRAGFGDPLAHGIPTHVTLLPPTEVDASSLPAIERHLAEVAQAGRPFRMRLSGTGTFRPLSPVVFVNVVEGSSACSWLQKRIRDDSGPVARELQFPYHPHVTVAHGIAEEAMDRAFEELAGYEAAWTTAGFALYEQGADGVWRLDREYPFGREPGPGDRRAGRGVELDAQPFPRTQADGRQQRQDRETGSASAQTPAAMPPPRRPGVARPPAASR